jgi:predicted TPR repeat methyltransferase
LNLLIGKIFIEAPKIKTMEKQINLNIPEAHALALRCHHNDLLAEAEMLYRKILESAPETLDTLHYLGLLCHQQGRNEEAAELIGRIIDIMPDSFDAHNNLGNVYEGMLKSDKAEECYRRALTINPDHAPAYNNLGVILMATDRPEEAVEAYLNAVRLSPDTAEHYFNLGNAYRKNGDYDGAIKAYTTVVGKTPDHVGAWQGLARSYLQSGRRDEAVQVFDNLIELNPDNPVFAYLRSACIGTDTPMRAPNDYLQNLFDEAAAKFDKHLELLEYRAPGLLCDALVAALSAPTASLDILDAGCGTGLCAPMLRPYALSLEGVDISQGMLAKASDRQLYNKLYKCELTQYLLACQGQYNVIVSADTLCYFGDLRKVFEGAFQTLLPGGLFGFTLEDIGNNEQSYRLNTNGRYAHAKGYLEAELVAAGLEIVTCTLVVLRNEAKMPVAGHLVVARKPPLK